MKKLIILSLFGLLASFSSFAQLAGTPGACVGSTAIIYDIDSTATGGTWSSSDISIATVAPTGFGAYADVTGVSAGVATITYSIGGIMSTYSFTVTAAPAAITGTTPTCVGSSSTLLDATAGGTWSSDDYFIASVSSSSGVVTGEGAGTTSIVYTVGPGCSVSRSVTISTITVSDSITGPTGVCVGATIALADVTTGGTWSSASTAVATVSSSGVVTGISVGSAEIFYTVSSTCAGSASAHTYITVSSSASAGTITGTTTVMAGSTTTLTDGVAGGVWSSGSTTTATVSTSGIVTGVAAGTAIIAYTVTGSCGTATTTVAITVTAFDGISGNINFDSGTFYGAVKVWLINYNPTTLMLTAVDSQIVYCGGTSVYYQFTGLATDSFRVKAATDSILSGSGYVPTYHTSSFYWHDADVIYHTSGTANTGENINMASGTATSGPGFIGGLVTSGANRGTSTGAPVAGLLIFIQNSATGAILQQTYTDVTGNYSFSGLPYGTYFVYPELINYATTPYTGITLNAASSSVSAANFMQHTRSLTITPIGDEAVNSVQSGSNAAVAFPNPTSGKLNIQWQTAGSETGTVSVCDITGREVYNAAIEMNAGSGSKEIDLSSLTNGLYLISVKSASISYNNKIEIQH